MAKLPDYKVRQGQVGGAQGQEWGLGLTSPSPAIPHVPGHHLPGQCGAQAECDWPGPAAGEPAPRGLWLLGVLPSPPAAPQLSGGLWGPWFSSPSLTFFPQNLLKCNPVQRISAEEALQHPYFTDFCPP